MNKQNLETELILLCDYALISKEGKLSALGIFEELRTTNPTAVLAKGFLVATLSGTPNTAYKLNIKAEHKVEKRSILPPLEMGVQTGPNGRSNLLLELVGITFPKEGIYDFKILSEKEEVGSTQLTVIKMNNNKEREVAN